MCMAFKMSVFCYRHVYFDFSKEQKTNRSIIGSIFIANSELSC